jgi:NADH-quinone oxidoreductase subunit N
VHGLPLTDYLLMLPMVELVIFALGILLIDLLIPREWKWINALGAFVGVLFATACVSRIQFALPPRGLLGFNNSLLVDRFAIYFWYLFLAAAAVSILTSVHCLELEEEHRGEYYALLLLSVVGMMCMAAGIDVVLMYAGLALTAVCNYLLVGFLRRERPSTEAALKYMLLGSFSYGALAYGLSLFYGLSGGTNLGTIARMVAGLNSQNPVSGLNPHNPIILIALFTTLTGLLFGISAFPLQRWTPAAFESAPTSASGFVSAGVIAAGWALLLRILLFGMWPLRSVYIPVIIFIAIATLTIGNVAALWQTNTKRLLAYASMAQVGYMLLALVAVGTSKVGGPEFLDSFKGILIYLAVYALMNLGAFAVVTSLRQRDVMGDEIDDLAGLYKRAPVELVLMLLFLISLAGIPPAAGFWGKYYVFLSLIESGHRVLAALGVIYSLIGFCCYFRVAKIMFTRAPMDVGRFRAGVALRSAIAITALATIVIGIYPQPLIRSVNWSLGIAPSKIAASPHAAVTK